MDALYAAHGAELRRYLRRLCGDADLADDLLQETLRRACAALPRVGAGANHRAWLYAIATNVARSAACAAYWRRSRSLTAADLERADGAAAPDVSAADNDLTERALAALKPDDRALMLLHWRAGFGIDELCQATGLGREALKKRLYRAKRAFSAAYTRELAHAEGRTP